MSDDEGIVVQVDNSSKPMSLKLIMEREKVDHMLATGQVRLQTAQQEWGRGAIPSCFFRNVPEA